MILPPVKLIAESAASSVDSNTGSGFFTSAKREGNCARSKVITDLNV